MSFLDSSEDPKTADRRPLYFFLIATLGTGAVASLFITPFRQNLYLYHRWHLPKMYVCLYSRRRLYKHCPGLWLPELLCDKK